MTAWQECYSGPLWHIAYCEPRAEKDVCADIARKIGYGVFMPMERFRPAPGAAPISRPLFQRYVPVEVDPYLEDWQEVLGVDGVIDVLRMPGSDVPGYVPTASIEALMKAEAVGIFDRTTRFPNDFKIGETVRICDGPFAGHNALITEFMAKMRSTTASKRAKLLVKFMTQMVNFDLPVTSLEKL
jgi:transcription antitermination factor NusG